ncbi:MAG: YraN family protein [Candidatus Kapabacteria bacterium]|nr:YraN family protein [Candidatus Kapabacteria bacterium]
MNNVQIGREAERKAAEYLSDKGYLILDMNFKFMHMGELDIVARQGSTLVFVEVRMRRTKQYGTPEGSLTPKKLRTIRRVAQAWMSRKNYHGRACRFDVVAIDESSGRCEIRHYENAF